MFKPKIARKTHTHTQNYNTILKYVTDPSVYKLCTSRSNFTIRNKKIIWMINVFQKKWIKNRTQRIFPIWGYEYCKKIHLSLQNVDILSLLHFDI